MTRILYILLLFSFTLQAQQYQYKPDFKSMFRTVYEPLIITALDSLSEFVVDAHDNDTAIVTTAIGFPPTADNYQLRYSLTGYPTISTGTLALSDPDSTEFQGLKIPIDVPSSDTEVWFRLFSTGVDTVFNSDTTQLDPIPVSPDFFAGGLLWIEGTDTTQYDSIYVNADSSILSFESDGLLFQIPPVAFIAEYQLVLDAMTTEPTGDTLAWGNALMDSLVTNGYYDDGHVLLMFATTDNGAGEALINWFNPGTYDATNGIGAAAATWTALSGYQGDGGDSIGTNYNPTTASLSQNAATVGIYLMIDQDESSFIYYADAGGAEFRLIVRSGDNTGSWKLNSNTTQGYNFLKSDGMWINTRRGATDIESYGDGVSVDTEADASDGVPDIPAVLLAGHDLSAPSTNQIAIFFILNAGIDDTQATQISGFFNTYMTNLGTNVY